MLVFSRHHLRNVSIFRVYNTEISLSQIKTVSFAAKQKIIILLIIFGYSLKGIGVSISDTFVSRNNIVNIGKFSVSLKWAVVSLGILVKCLAFRNTDSKSVIFLPAERFVLVERSKNSKNLFKSLVNAKIFFGVFYIVNYHVSRLMHLQYY